MNTLPSNNMSSPPHSTNSFEDENISITEQAALKDKVIKRLDIALGIIHSRLHNDDGRFTAKDQADNDTVCNTLMNTIFAFCKVVDANTALKCKIKRLELQLRVQSQDGDQVVGPSCRDIHAKD